MSETEIPIDIDNIITEDDTPVKSFFSEKHHRLLTEPLYSNWSGPGKGRPFIVAANVGIFASVNEPAIVPDVFLSMNVRMGDLQNKGHRSYFLWEFGKPPEVVIEIVVDEEGNEASEKLRRYARMGIIYYVIYDPLQQLKGDVLTIYELHVGEYEKSSSRQMSKVGLGLTLWDGKFEFMQAKWLRWCDENGKLIPTGAELFQQRRQLSEQKERAEQERQRAERLAEVLRAMGKDPDQI